MSLDRLIATPPRAAWRLNRRAGGVFLAVVALMGLLWARVSVGAWKRGAPHVGKLPALAVDVYRDGRLVAEGSPLEEVPIEVGDVLRMQLVGVETPFVVLQVREAAAWATLFAGAPPDAGWLPFFAEVTAATTRVRLLTCWTAVATEPWLDDLPPPCAELIYDF
ncbi:MAG TPA: hypothetical protein VFH51_19325 [Myxococcota bacterium]|nr:hypothetical protein [Myxococcota bacterium]